MKLYKIDGKILSLIEVQRFKYEKNLQTLFEDNLNIIMGLEMVKSEFSIGKKRIDTLAYNKKLRSFVIIEYKKVKTSGVMDQGFSYLNLTKDHKADFVVAYIESSNLSLKQPIKRSDVDWAQSKVVFVAPSFTDTQKNASDYESANIELLEVKKFASDIVSISLVSKLDLNEDNIYMNKQDERSRQIKNETIEYTEDYHLSKSHENIQKLYKLLRDKIIGLTNDVELVHSKLTAMFKKDNKTFTNIVLYKEYLYIFLNAKWGKLDDDKGIAQNMSKKGHWGSGDYKIRISDDSQMAYILGLIKEVIQIKYNKN